MYRKISDRIQYPEWAKRWTRYKRLDVLDRLLDGTFYDHLPNAFYDEQEGEKPIPIADRRPSAQFKLPRMVARWSARKLFAGRHRPKLRFPKPKEAAPKPAAPGATPKPAKKPAKPQTPQSLKDLNRLLRRSCFWQKMGEAVFRGSVGSVAITFRVEVEADARLALYLWPAKYCQPSFDDYGALAQLRVAYTTRGSGLVAAGFDTDNNGKPIDPNADYWFIRDYEPDQELTYIPVPKDEWNPADGFTGMGMSTKKLNPFEEKTVKHGLGFVPGHWFINMAGGTAPDGDSTWADAIPNSIDLDYTLSQLGRGTRYNAAPQLVIKGELLNDGDITRGPMTALQVRAGYKEEDGMTIGEGGAELLEMTGEGIKAGLEFIDKLRNFALEQIAASRKDPDKMAAPMSGRAMEYLDEDSDDLVMDLRSQYGEDGALPLVRKIAIAAEVMSEDEAGQLLLQWPRLFQPTPDEVLALMQAFQIAVDPAGHSAPSAPEQPAEPGGSGPDGKAKPGKPKVPAQPAQLPDISAQFLTMEEARAYILLNLDLAMLDLEEGDDAEDVDDSPTPPGEPTEVIPTPSAIDEDIPAGTPEGDQGLTEPTSAAIAAEAVGDLP